MSVGLAVAIKDLKFRYRPDLPFVLDIPRWEVFQGHHTFLHGPSGSGKTTLLGLIAGILANQAGQLAILGQDYSQLPYQSRDQFRGEQLGYIFQMFNLIPYLSVRENIVLPCRLSAGRAQRVAGDIQIATVELAGRLGIGQLLDRPVTDLSVGQQQRVAAARALLGSPQLIIADEPTSALDADHRESFIELLFEEAKRVKSTILFVSHDHSLSTMFDEKVSLQKINLVMGGPR